MNSPRPSSKSRLSHTLGLAILGLASAAGSAAWDIADEPSSIGSPSPKRPRRAPTSPDETRPFRRDERSAARGSGGGLVADALSHEEVVKLHEVSVALGLGQHREALLAGMCRAFVSSIPEASSIGAQLSNDLHQCNAAGTLADGSEPLVQWLEKALSFTRHRPEAAVFRDTLLALNPRREGPATASLRRPPARASPSGYDGCRCPRSIYRSSRWGVLIIPITIAVMILFLFAEDRVIARGGYRRAALRRCRPTSRPRGASRP